MTLAIPMIIGKKIVKRTTNPNWGMAGLTIHITSRGRTESTPTMPITPSSEGTSRTFAWEPLAGGFQDSCWLPLGSNRSFSDCSHPKMDQHLAEPMEKPRIQLGVWSFMKSFSVCPTDPSFVGASLQRCSQTDESLVLWKPPTGKVIFQCSPSASVESHFSATWFTCSEMFRIGISQQASTTGGDTWHGQDGLWPTVDRIPMMAFWRMASSAPWLMVLQCTGKNVRQAPGPTRFFSLFFASLQHWRM